MLKWIEDSNKYEEVHKAYFGSYEITVIRFASGGTCAWAKEPGITSPHLLKKSYPAGMTIEETKEKFLKELREHLDERVTFWMNIQHALWLEEQWLDEEDE